MLPLQDLRPAEGPTHKAKRLGQGPGSGKGKTAGKGNKGDKARTGGGVRPGFEGGQMPLTRRTPKRGFNNYRFAKVFQVVNLEALDRKFDAGALVEAGILKNVHDGIRILGNGELTKKLTVKAQGFTKSAVQKIEAAGGSHEVAE